MKASRVDADPGSAPIVELSRELARSIDAGAASGTLPVRLLSTCRAVLKELSRYRRPPAREQDAKRPASRDDLEQLRARRGVSA